MGVLIFFAALTISLMRGTPNVMFMAATPAKWNVLSVICVPGSPMLWAPKAPTVDPAGQGDTGTVGASQHRCQPSADSQALVACLVASPFTAVAAEQSCWCTQVTAGGCTL